jgi:hypothetical protein
MLSLFVEIGGLATFFPRLVLNHDPPDLYLSSSWNYRCELIHLVLSSFFFFLKWNLANFFGLGWPQIVILSFLPLV